MDIVNTLLPANKILRYVVLLLLIGVIALTVHQLNHPLRKYPAANLFVTIPYIGEIWFAWLTLKGDPDKTLRELHRNLGKFVRIGPNEVSIDDSDAVKELYGHGNDIEKGSHRHIHSNYSTSLLGICSIQMDHVLFNGNIWSLIHSNFRVKFITQRNDEC
jgi:hypothetical protein